MKQPKLNEVLQMTEKARYSSITPQADDSSRLM